MRISGFERIDLGDRLRVVTTIEWETAPREQQRIFAEVPVEVGEGFVADPNAFLVAAFVPAWVNGERRLMIDGPVCPVLLNRIEVVHRTLRHWYPELGEPPTIEAGERMLRQPADGGACAMLSCGIDSLYTLRQNDLDVDRSHPLAIRGALTANFFSGQGDPPIEWLERRERSGQRCAAVASDLGIDAIPVTTNVLTLEPNGNIYAFFWHSAVLLMLAYLFGDRFSAVYVGSSYDVSNLEPWGSNPILDLGYEAGHLRVIHDGHGRTRMQKMATVSEWQVGIDLALVCQGDKSWSGNCGTCEKCIRTQVALEALGRLATTTSFRSDRMTPELLRTVANYDMIYNDSQLGYYEEMREPLERSGRDDLVDCIDAIAEHYRAKRGAADTASRSIEQVMGENLRFAVADDGLYGIPVTPASGHYWGQPKDAAQAIRQVDALRHAGYGAIAIADQSWWLDSYEGLGDHLKAGAASVVHENGWTIYLA